MLTDKIIPAKECAHCRCLFTPNRYVAHKFCSRSCASLARMAANPKLWQEQRAKATERSRVIKAARRAEALVKAFGELSARELLIAAAIRRQGYMDGYNAAYGSPRSKPRKSKAAA